MCNLVENYFVELMKNYNSGFYSIKKLIKLMCYLIDNFFFYQINENHNSIKKLIKLMCNLIENFVVKLMKNYNPGFYSIKKLIKLMCN